MSWFSELWNETTSWIDNTWNWCKEQWDDFMDNLVYYMNNFWDWFGMVFIIGIGLIIIGTVLSALGVLNWIWGGLTEIGGWIAGGWKWLSGWGIALKKYWDKFAEWLHLEEIKKAHDIGLTISPEYREAVDKVYGEIAQVSEQLGLGSGTMLLALSDARNMVLDASSLFGHPYDVAEVEWMGNLNGYLEEFNEKAETFKNNPAALILDIEAYFEPDIITAKSKFQITMLDFMGTSIRGLAETGNKLVKLKDTMEQTILHLPAKISGPIYRKMEDEFESFDKFMDDKFTPAINNVSAVVNILSDDSKSHGRQLGDIAGLMSNPGEMLANINELPEIERLKQEAQICEISSRGYRTESNVRNEVIDEDNKQLVLLEEALRKERIPPQFLRLEYEGAPKPATKPYGVFASWQVGDY